MAEGGAGAGADLTALRALPAETSRREPRRRPSLLHRKLPPQAAGCAGSAGYLSAPRAAGRAASWRGIGLQTAFNRELTAALKGLESDGSAFWWLGGFSFLYGIVHAAGRATARWSSPPTSSRTSSGSGAAW